MKSRPKQTAEPHQREQKSDSPKRNRPAYESSNAPPYFGIQVHYQLVERRFEARCTSCMAPGSMLPATTSSEFFLFLGDVNQIAVMQIHNCCSGNSSMLFRLASAFKPDTAIMERL